MAWSEATRGPNIVNGVRGLPLELREALLLVALARFTHAEAAQALDIPLSRLIERLNGRAVASRDTWGWTLTPHAALAGGPVRTYGSLNE